MTKIADLRREYKLLSLNETDVTSDPFDQFSKWWDAAVKSNIEDVNAMTLGTATVDGKPSLRIVLLKEYDKKGFTFFTNYESAKAVELSVNPKACVLFFWKELERQVKIEGITEKISAAENDAYFYSRPEGSRIGAWASPQSRVIKTRSVLEENFATYKEQFNEKTIPRPSHWGGYRIKPQLIEFWQGRPNRLHDRIQYSLQKDNTWKIERLAP